MLTDRSTPQPGFEAATQNGNQDVAEKGQQSSSEKSPGPGMASFPEGGFRAWTIVLGSSIAMGCAFGYISAFG